MAYHLNELGAVAYTDLERRLFYILREHRKLDSVRLSELAYERRSRPANYRVSAMQTVKILMEKVARNREPFLITKSPRNGPNPIFFRLVPRPRPWGKKAGSV